MTIPTPPPPLVELNSRSAEIFQLIVDAYVESGEPVGSRTVSRRLETHLSPATIRNVMADLEDAGLLFSPHTSAGRLPTEKGLKMFVSGLLEIGGKLDEPERQRLDEMCRTAGKSVEDALTQAIATLSGLARCAGLVVAPKRESGLKHIEFVHLGPGRALVVLVSDTGVVENRLIELPPDLPPSALREASNYLAARLGNRTLAEARQQVLDELESRQAQLDALTRRVVEAGLATWSSEGNDGALIVRGQAHLLNDIQAGEDLERIRGLFEALETREHMLKLLDLAHQGEGVQIFIGSENQLFASAGCSMIVAPYQNTNHEVIGAIGVIGPTRLNYARIIPLVDYTAKVIGRLIG
ncbi:heat-inducible transcriptional repressor HrcA [Roseospirillum parvum]|uniref:Heat-inducible transcription repressor HrcA n=1 Tax=Roseospirillum parvum TaxID=83401 RepID=A0A1G8DRW2_9PROT|nr:heat-inducible transcriptional repressor HrcA [Roseospirillum parvum]SDH60301.1 heat-inducible transcriptional repressor [Roseospirillum parvum]